MSRQRLRPALSEGASIPCPRCGGSGHIRDTESSALQILRIIQEESLKDNTASVLCQVPVDVASFLLNEKRTEIAKIELKQRINVLMVPNKTLETPNYKLERLKHDDPRLDGMEVSYKMADEVEDPTSVTRRSQEPTNKQTPLIKGVLPDAPAPVAPVKAEAPPAHAPRVHIAPAPVAAPAPAPAAPAAPAEKGFFGWVKNLFGAPAATPPSAPAPQPAKQESKVEEARPPRDGRRPEGRDGVRAEGRGEARGRGGRGGRGGRADRGERPPQGQRERDDAHTQTAGTDATALGGGEQADLARQEARGERAPRNGERGERGGRGRNGADRGERAERGEPRAKRGDAGGEARQDGSSEGRPPREAREGRDGRRDRRPRPETVNGSADPMANLSGQSAPGAEATQPESGDAANRFAGNEAGMDNGQPRERRPRERNGRDRGPRADRPPRDQERVEPAAVEDNGPQQALEGFAAPTMAPQAAPVAMPTPAAAAGPTINVPGLPKVQPYQLPLDELAGVAQQSGLNWVNSNPEKINAAQAALAALPKPIHVPRERPAPVVLDDAPLVLVETRRDLRAMTLPFEQTTPAT